MASTPLDRSGQEAMDTALGNKLVIRRIFSFLTFNDLKECRLVARNWNFESGSYLRDFQRCNFTSDVRTPCADLLTLNELARQGPVLAINSLKIQFWGHSIHSSCDHCCSTSAIYTELLEKLSLKHLCIKWDTHFEPAYCPAYQFVRDIFREKTGEILTLEFGCLAPNFRHCYTDETRFPKLKELDLGANWEGIWEDHEDFLLKIIKSSPNLSKLRGQFDGCMAGIPEEAYFMLDSFCLWMLSVSEETTCLKLAKAQPALSLLTVSNSFELKPAHNASYFYVLEQLFQSSRKSLKKLNVNSVQFSLGQLSVPPLVVLKTLTLNARATWKEMLSFLQSIEYPKLMPALAEVKIDEDCYPNVPEDGIENDVVPTQMHRSKTVKILKVKTDVNPITFQRLSEIFPSLNSLNIRPNRIHTRSIPYETLWACWPHLEMINVVEGEDALNWNFDSDFLGIHPEELDILKELNDEELDNINIVPIRPSVLTMTGLKLIKVQFHGFGIEDEDADPNLVFLSRLTGILALKKMTKIGIRVHFASPFEETVEDLRHLMPYASVYCNDYEY